MARKKAQPVAGGDALEVGIIEPKAIDVAREEAATTPEAMSAQAPTLASEPAENTATVEMPVEMPVEIDHAVQEPAPLAGVQPVASVSDTTQPNQEPEPNQTRPTPSRFTNG